MPVSRHLMMIAALTLCVVPAAFAQAPAAEKPEAEKPAAAKPAPRKSPEPKADKKDIIGNPNSEDNNPVQVWIAAENKLIDTLSAKDQETFFVMRNKHGVIRAVKVVERDIKNAVKACGKNNPDMKEPMDTRFKQWQNAILPTIDLAEKYLKEEIDTQKVVFPSDFRHVLALNDKAYEYGESRIEKQPVTTKEACGELLESMDRTENKMVDMLQDMLLPESVIRERAARAEAEEDAE